LATEPLDPALIASLTAQLPPVQKNKVQALKLIFVDDHYTQLEDLLRETHPDHVMSELVEALSKHIVELELQLENERAATEEAKREAARAKVEAQPALELRAVESPAGHGEASGRAPAPTTATARGENSTAWQMFADLNAGLGLSQCPAAAHGREYQFAPDELDQFGRKIKQT
jgi:hypothetical protein